MTGKILDPASSLSWGVPAAALFGGAIILIAGANVPLFLWLNAFGRATGDDLWAWITVLGDASAACAVGLFFARRRADLLWALVLALLLAALWVRGIKTLVDVKRPLVLGEAVHVIGPAHRERSFPSGHATTAFALAGVIALGLRRRRWTCAALALACLIAVSRSVVGVHWPLDLMASAFGGWLAAVLAVRWCSRCSWPLAQSAQAATIGVFGAFAILLLAGYNAGYAVAEAELRLLGAFALAGFTLSFFSPRSAPMDRIDAPLLSKLQPAAGEAPQVSIVVPLFDEEENVAELVHRIGEAMSEAGHHFELICVNDGSRDRTGLRLAELVERHAWLRPLHLMRNYGQAVALQAGFDHARAPIIVTLDGDLQNDPADIPRLLAIMDERAEVDVICGWRVDRKDGLLRRWPSLVANKLISAVTGVHLHDYGCTLKLYRAPVIGDLKLYGELHRFVPALAAEVGARIIEVPVTHHPRKRGASKYGIGRTLRVLLDLVWIKFLLAFLRRPMHAFGGVGMALFLIGGGTLAYLAFDKLALGHDIGGRPLLLLGALVALIGVQVTATGVIGELLVRVYHEPQGRALYLVREARKRA